MVSRRQHTESYIEQPVRFYKFIALTFLLLTIVLLGMVIFMSSKRAVITITTKATPIEVNAEVTIGPEGTPHTVNGLVKVSEVSGSQTFSPKGSKEVPAQATGMVTLVNDSTRPQPLIATTRLQTADGVIFRLKEGVTVPAQGVREQVEVYSDKEGKDYNIGPSEFTIPGLNAARQKEVYARSTAPMTGGVRFIGSVDAEDLDTAREQLKASLLAQGQEEIAAQYPEMGVVYGIDNIETNSASLVGDEIVDATLTGKATLVAVIYDKEGLKEWAERQLLKRAIGDGELVRPGSEEPTVTFAGFNESDGTARLNVFYGGVMTLAAESKQIDAQVFFGKSRDEVRRYVLSLDHVHSVDVELKPAWMQSVPHIADHVSLIVREVE